MNTNAHHSLPRLMRAALSFVYYAKNIKWSALAAWLGLTSAFALCALGTVYLLSDDIQFRRASFSSQELRDWEAYATLVGKSSLAELAAAEKKSKDASLPDAWVRRTFLENLAAPVTYSSPPSSAEAQAASSQLPGISALMFEKESLRIKIHKSLTSWETCKKPAIFWGPKPISASSTSLEVACHAMTNHHEWALDSTIFFLAFAIFSAMLNLFARERRRSIYFLPEILQFRFKQRRADWLEAHGGQLFARLEALSIALSSPRWPGRRSPTKPRRL